MIIRKGLKVKIINHYVFLTIYLDICILHSLQRESVKLFQVHHIYKVPILYFINDVFIKFN